MNNSIKFFSILSIFFCITSHTIAQESINWLTIDQFEKAIQKGESNYFILIDDNRVANVTEDVLKQRNEHLFSYLNDEEIINYLNKNFICFRFTPNIESISFNGITYEAKEETNRIAHEFINFLSSSERNYLPSIILKDERFNLFTYKASNPNIQQLTILFEAEELKTDYIVKKLGQDNPLAIRSTKMLDMQQQQLIRAKENNGINSVFSARQNKIRLLQILTYFATEGYKQIDFETYIKRSQ